jgi:hypothetical protein
VKYHLTDAEGRALEGECGPHCPGAVLERARFYMEHRMTTDPAEAVVWARAWHRNAVEQAQRRMAHGTGARSSERPPPTRAATRPGTGTRRPPEVIG